LTKQGDQKGKMAPLYGYCYTDSTYGFVLPAQGEHTPGVTRTHEL